MTTHKIVPLQSTNDIREAMRDKNTMQAKWAAGIAAAPPTTLVTIEADELAALKRDAERWRWLDSRTDHTWEKLARMSISLTRNYIDAAIAKEKTDGQ